MDYSAIINSIHAERLELVERLAENRLDLLGKINLLTTTALSMIHLISLVMEQYLLLKNDISMMLDMLVALEEKHSTGDLLIALE